MPVIPWAVYGDGIRKENGEVDTCCFTVTAPKQQPSPLLAAAGRSPPFLRERRHKQQHKQDLQQPLVSKLLREALEECSEDEEDATANSSGVNSSGQLPTPVVVPAIFGRYPYDGFSASASEVPSTLLRCKRAEEQQEALLLAAAAAVSAAMQQQLQGICRIVRTHAAVGALELQQPHISSCSSTTSRRHNGSLCEFLPVVIMHVGADVEDHRLAVRMLQLQLQQLSKCCCGGRRSSRGSRGSSSASSKDELFLRQVVLRANSCTNAQTALRTMYGQLKASSCCSTCIGRSGNGSRQEKEVESETGAVAEEIAADAAAAAAWGEFDGVWAQQQQLLLLRCLEGMTGDDNNAGTGPAQATATEEDEGAYWGHDISSRLGQLWQKQLQQHSRGFCCISRCKGDGSTVKTRSQHLAATGNSGSSSDDSSSEDGGADDRPTRAQEDRSRSNSSNNSVLVVVLEELEAFAPRVLSQVLLLVSLLRSQQGIPVVVLASAAASAIAIQQLLEPSTLRMLQIDAAALLRPSAVHDALLQLLLCCPASTLFVLPAAAIEELQQLLLDQGASVLQLLRLVRMMLYKFFADHPFSFISLDARVAAAALCSPSTSNTNIDTRSSNNRGSRIIGSSKESTPSAKGGADGASGDQSAAARLAVLEWRLALLAAAVLTPHQETVLLQQITKFQHLHAELRTTATARLESPCCSSWRAQQQQQEGCNRTPACAPIERALGMLQYWWDSAGTSAAADQKQSLDRRRAALQRELLPAAALQVLERRIAAGLGMRLLVVLQQHVMQQRQAFALSASETAAALQSLDSSSSTLPAVNLLLQILGGSGRTPGYHDYLLQGKQLTSAPAAAHVVSLICEEVKRIAGACCRVGGLVTTLVSEALNAAATTRRVAAVPKALLLALQQFCRQTKREWALLLQLEERMQHHQQQQRVYGIKKAAELHRIMNKLMELLQLTCDQQQRQQQSQQNAPSAFVSGLKRRARAIPLSSTEGLCSSNSDSGLCGRFQSWARECLLYCLLPLLQWHPLGCELGVWSLSVAAAEQPQFFAAALAAPRSPTHRAEAGAADTLARLQPLQPIEVLQELACLSGSALEYHQQAAVPTAGRGEIKQVHAALDDTGLLYRRIAFSSRRISLWSLFCLFCTDLVGAYKQNWLHHHKQQQKQQQKCIAAKGKGRRAEKVAKKEEGSNAGLSEEADSVERKALAVLQQDAEVSCPGGIAGPKSLLQHIFLRFGVALCSLEHLGLVRLPGTGVSADDLLLRTAVKAHAADTAHADAEDHLELLMDARASEDPDSSTEAAGDDPKEHQYQQKERGQPTLGQKPRLHRTVIASADAFQLQQQLQGLCLTRCLFGSVYFSELQEEADAKSQQADSNGDQKQEVPQQQQEQRRQRRKQTA
ncbi:hypothetical protein, conserved [Eimeria necatrix]|uniref:Origin recognition complex subunit 3 N-terminal domain-containing protein n=1 Tax=Eimeria necatrix TaxID=51315 RepID=U6N0L9_9EIME|nr:hypothetical protein, conserved [Eimeria necatrix]CDJ68853.1 hypothetical protein, conserved [Eimeria necatrix]